VGGGGLAQWWRTAPGWRAALPRGIIPGSDNGPGAASRADRPGTPGPLPKEETMKRERFSILAAAVVLALLSRPAAGDKGKATLDRDEARKIGERLNAIRKDPARYGKEIGVDLSDVKPRGELKWDATLAKVAEAKALDMANREYFDHVTPEGKGIN